MYNKMSSFESGSSDGDLCQPVCDPDPYYEANGGSYYTQLYPADSQNTGTQVITIMEEEGYWGSPCSSTNESQQADANLGPGHAHHRSSAAVSTIRLLTATHLAPPPASCGDPSPSSCSSSSSSPSTSSSVSSSVYGHQQRHQLQSSLIGGYPCLRSPDADADQHHPHHPSHHHHHHQQQQQQQHHQPQPHSHHHHHQPSPVYDCPMVYEKNVNAYIPDEGYYGGGNGTPMHVTSGGGTVDAGNDHYRSSYVPRIIVIIGGVILTIVCPAQFDRRSGPGQWRTDRSSRQATQHGQQKGTTSDAEHQLGLHLTPGPHSQRTE
ncbi:protein doublesex-like isoform X1 [Anopheles darlingi]|uniref:protein doublesex-like isoform X1 n=1 Tax=Anopheles darlingi TaxID=43151 RepID=UPI0021002857|nr:protein doublesex-like isoform X1 [Anopheles darlingi]